MQSKTNKATNRSLNKKEILFILGFSLFFVYFFFLFKQIEVIQNNQSEFGIMFSEIIASYIFIVILIYAVMCSILMFLCYYFKNVYKYTILVLFGLEIASYVQLLFLNDSRVVNINGHTSATVMQYIVNALLYAMFWSLPIVVYKLVVRNRNKNNQEQKDTKENEKETNIKSPVRPYKTIILIMAIIFGMQAVGWITAIPKYHSVSADDTLYYFSIDDQMKLSKNDNVITFVLDRLDTKFVNEIFEKHPEDKDIFSGFTYYTDNISLYPGTFPSVVGLLSGKNFDKQQTQKEFMEDAWNEPVLFDALKANNYKVNGLLNSIATFYEFDQVQGKFDNIKKLEKKNRNVKEVKFFGSVTTAAFNQFMPFCLKGLFIGYITIPNDCVAIKNTPDYFPKTVSPDSDLALYERLTAEDGGLTADEEQNVFNFVHLLASHNPFGYNANLKATNNTTQISQTRGTFKILQEYFNQMKKLGIYEDATIIVMADHGQWSSRKNRNAITAPPMASLFIKESGKGSNNVEEVVPMQQNDDAQLYHANYLPSIIEVLYNNDNASNQAYYDAVKANNKSYFDVVNSNGEQERQYYYVRWTNMNSTFYKGKFTIKGNANDKDSWEKVK